MVLAGLLFPEITVVGTTFHRSRSLRTTVPMDQWSWDLLHRVTTESLSSVPFAETVQNLYGTTVLALP